MKETAGRIVTARFIFSGMGDYWSGDGERWEENKGCLFAHYGRETTLRQLIDCWVEDSRNGDLDDKAPWSDVSDEEIRAALVDMLTPAGRAEYENEKAGPCEQALSYAEANPEMTEMTEEDEERWDSPVAIVLMTVENAEENET